MNLYAKNTAVDQLAAALHGIDERGLHDGLAECGRTLPEHCGSIVLHLVEAALEATNPLSVDEQHNALALYIKSALSWTSTAGIKITPDIGEKLAHRYSDTFIQNAVGTIAMLNRYIPIEHMEPSTAVESAIIGLRTVFREAEKGDFQPLGAQCCTEFVDDILQTFIDEAPQEVTSHFGDALMNAEAINILTFLLESASQRRLYQAVQKNTQCEDDGQSIEYEIRLKLERFVDCIIASALSSIKQLSLIDLTGFGKLGDVA